LQRSVLMRSNKRGYEWKQAFCNFVRDESGQDLIEYALVAAIIALGATAAMTSLATSISTAFSKIGSSLTSAV
jgi:pilus assembly protein Flp/PilA